uniref:Uncharacterized protein n=1 Tax=Candidatus Kentrum sp. UNK TaxID=2126344 RepID=A0A450ZY50_9GAMM|nr:MAG: hypothetical protein BECKUNK1418G_GA0071005_100442 [Candidatus Kentron sp. UNK]VFK68530.1 MAG: hypothetical protein BECKUNK1418H_GA0071006_100344 [Candidatus Kentron sp. UNK]
MSKFTDKFWYVFWVSKLFGCCSHSRPRREAEEWAGSGQQECCLPGLSTRPEGRRPIRRTRPQVHKILRNIARTELRCHPWLLDSANPWRNDGSGFNKYYRIALPSSSRYERWNTGLGILENYPRIFLKSQKFKEILITGSPLIKGMAGE